MVLYKTEPATYLLRWIFSFFSCLVLPTGARATYLFKNAFDFCFTTYTMMFCLRETNGLSFNLANYHSRDE